MNGLIHIAKNPSPVYILLTTAPQNDKKKQAKTAQW
jgi:hypothetical protein